ncbi:nitroreductase/quinone reductase family protein [Nonomuraea sp. NPDC050556]|uniref:nitroreductase/quinone reductase family protein n=1 Tax=Nonomuraea sp. NPDC050556 TaxID=3364369 RepID=UPI0037AD0206
MSRNTMIMRVVGRKSGRTYTFPVRYQRHEDTITCYTDSGWWKNLRGGAPVTVLVRGRQLHGTAHPVTDKELVAGNLLSFLRQTPRDCRYYGVLRDTNGGPDPDSVTRAANITTMVTVRLSSKE